MAFDNSFGVSEIYIGNTTNRISIDSNGNMVLQDGYVIENGYPDGISMQELIELSSNITFDTLVNTEGSTVNKKYIMKKVDTGWEVEEFTESTSDTISVQIEVSDWVEDATAINGNPGYTVEIPHNLSLTLPDDLLHVQVWDGSYSEFSPFKITQGVNSVTIVSETNPILYVIMR